MQHRMILLLTVLAVFFSKAPAGNRTFSTVILLEKTSETSANASVGDFGSEKSWRRARPHLFSHGKGGFSEKKPFGPVKTSARASAAGDLNGDGRMDLVVGDYKRGSRVYLNKGQGEFGDGLQLTDPALGVGAIAIGDMNRDGTADIVIGYAAAPGSVFFNGGNGADFQQMRFGDAKGTVYGIAVGDLNNDEFLDIVLGLSDAPNKAYLSGL